uniref:GNAT family acetyltransferase n=1 Tax=Sciadococcus taiwanensis TaxID=3028030 RepID=A0A9Y1MWS0_9RHOD|nr:GNAT family acetyltransferase [Sciadococcus taiwanensis]
MSLWNSLFQFSQSFKKQEKDNADYTKELNTSTISYNRYLEHIYIKKNSPINLYELEELCYSVGWSRRPLRKVKKALQHSYLVISVIENQQGIKRLIGFARVTSDYAFNATIWDVVIHPKFQRRGLGKILMQEIIRELRKEDIANITLFADPQVVNFYETLGFLCDPDGVKGMFWYPN